MKGMIIILLCMIQIVVAQTEVEISIVASDNIDSQIVQVADDTINTEIVCISGTCNYGFGLDNITLPDNAQLVSINQSNTWLTQYTTKKGSSIGDFLGSMARVAHDYMVGNHRSGTAWQAWALLDAVFVSHKEDALTINNIDYLAGEVDRLTAENRLLRETYSIDLDKAKLACYTAIEQSKRTHSQVNLTDGRLADFDRTGDVCWSLDR